MDKTKQNLIELVEKLRQAGLGHPDISCRGQDGLPCKCSICRHNVAVNKTAKELVLKINKTAIFEKPNPQKEKVILARVSNC